LVLTPGETTQKKLATTVLRIDKDADLALLKAEGKGLTALELGDTRELIETTPVTVFGYSPSPDATPRPEDGPALTIRVARVTGLNKKAGILQRIQLDVTLPPGNSGGPVLDSKGRLLGMLTSEEGASKFTRAIPANRLALFLSKPEILFSPPPIPVGKQSEPLDFRFTLASPFPLRKDLTVTFTLIEPGQSPRQSLAKATGVDTYTAKAMPILPRKGPPRVQLTLPTEPTPTIFQTPDREVKVGIVTLKLSDLARIETINGTTTATLQGGKQLVGQVQGLEAVEAHLNGVPATLDLNRVASLTLQKADPLPGFVAYLITVKQGAQTLTTHEGTLLMDGAVSEQPITLPNGMVLGKPVFNPANGHWYRCGTVPDDITWTEARRTAERLTYQGWRGHLVTITSEAENTFVYDSFPETKTIGCWLGGFQDKQAKDYSEPAGAWSWVTGERWSYSIWHHGLYQEPNDGLGGHEDYLSMTGNGKWNDLPDVRSDRMRGFIVEFER
jgi:hypothetical protein